jgi:hypothetical protein
MGRVLSNLTQVEREILNVLREAGEGRARYVHERLSKIRPIGYTRTLNTMQVMVRKGLLDRRMDGRSRIYTPLVQNNTAKKPPAGLIGWVTHIRQSFSRLSHKSGLAGCPKIALAALAVTALAALAVV